MTPARLAELETILAQTTAAFSPVYARELLEEVKRLAEALKLAEINAEHLKSRAENPF